MNVIRKVFQMIKRYFPVPMKTYVRETETMKNRISQLQIEVSSLRQENEQLLTEIDAVRRDIHSLSWGDYCFTSPEAQYTYACNLDSGRYPQELCKWYFQKTNRAINLNDPRTFNEKIQWMKLYDSTPIKTKLADKYLARAWISNRIGEEYLVPLLGVWDSFDEINWDCLPDRFALKATHGSGWNIIVKDKTAFDKDDAKRQFDSWMSRNYAFCNGYELHYLNIPPKIMAEQYIENTEGLIDYRFYCFNGTPVQVWVDIYSGTPSHLRSIFDMNWDPIDLRCTWPDGGDLLSKKPATFDTMKQFASNLSTGFPFVRVDFFEVDGKLYVGEMTFTPMSGIGMFDPPEWDLELGKMIILPEKSPIPNAQIYDET